VDIRTALSEVDIFAPSHRISRAQVGQIWAAMKRFLNPEIALGFVLGVFVLLFMASVLSYQIERCVQLDNSTQQSQIASAAEKAGELKHDHSGELACGIVGYKDSFIRYVDDNEGFFVAFFTLFLGLATIALWRSTDKLWAAGELQREQFSKSSERQLRAYVYLENAWFKYRGSGTWEITYRIRNAGQTPAHHVSVAEEVRVVDWYNGNVKLPGLQGLNSPLGSMAPLGDFYDNTASSSVLVTKAELDSKSKAVYLLGCIHYTDVFEKQHWSKFCYYFGGDVGYVGKEMFADHKGNDSE
jgi:hypothetical protein